MQDGDVPVDEWDVVVVGGGGAGLAAALTSARARRRTLVVDSGAQRNRFGHRSHGVLGFDGELTPALTVRGRTEVSRYGGALQFGVVTTARRHGDGFVVRLADGDELATRHLLVATGVRDELPPVSGLAAQWGRGVVVCPYCDGWETRDRRIGILATGRKSVEQAQLLRQWSASIIFLTNDAVTLTEEDRAAFDARGIEVQDGPVRRVHELDGELRGVEVDGRVIELDRIFIAPTAVPNDAVLRMLGAEMVEQPGGTLVRAGPAGATSVAGLWAAGNVVNPSLKVSTAVGNGMAAGADLNESLVREDIALALRQAGQPQSALG